MRFRDLVDHRISTVVLLKFRHYGTVRTALSYLIFRSGVIKHVDPA